jgi:hypothetical protein
MRGKKVDKWAEDGPGIPPGFTPAVPSSGRFLCVDFESTKPSEEAIEQDFLPWIESEIGTLDDIGATYFPRPPIVRDGQRQYRTTLFVHPPTEDWARKAQPVLEAKLRDWHRVGRLGRCQVTVVDEKKIYYPHYRGERWLRYAERVGTLCCRAIVEYFVRAEGSAHSSDPRLRAAVMTHEILMATGMATTRETAAHLLRDWIRVNHQEFMHLPWDEAVYTSAAPQLAEIVSEFMRELPSQDPLWSETMTRLSSGLREALAGFPEDVRSFGGELEIKLPGVDPLALWIGNRLIHPNFCRFYVSSTRECVLTWALAHAVESGLILDGK